MSRTAPLDEIAGQLGALARRLDGLEEDRRADGALVQQIAAKVGLISEPPDDEGQNRDKPVPCPKCGSKIGYYDEEADLVRTRHREHLVWMRMGPGGSIVIVCRKCSFPVEVSYTPPDDAAVAEVRDGILVMDVPMLTEWLETALKSGSGQVTLKLRDGSR